MKMGKHAGILMAAAISIAGCKNFFNVSNGGTGCTSNCSTVTSGIFYVLNSNTGQYGIAGYSIVNGTLTSLTGSPYSVPSGPYAIAIAPNNSFLYVSTQSGIYLYTIGSTGALTLASTTPIFNDFVAYSMQVDSTNSWLVEASGSGFLYAIPIDSTSGAASTTGKVQQVVLSALTARQMTISPDNTNVFVTLGISGTAVIPFAAASATPLPQTVSTVIAVKGAGGAAVSVAVDPSNRLLYIGETLSTTGSANTGGLRAFLYSSLAGTPTEISGSPIASGGLTPAAILPISSGNFVYVANATVSNGTNGNIAGFAVAAAGTTYSLTALSATASTGVTPVGLAEDSTGSLVLAVNSGGSPDLSTFTFGATTGTLSTAVNAATGTDPVGARAVAAAP
jgi:6-phosphogluconolactonase (cycloisomerase 2 family)